jgi:hypothetical protein
MNDVPVLHFADGVVLAISVDDAHLVDLVNHRQLEVEPPYVSAAEQVALGWRPDAFLDLLPELLEDQVICEGPQGVDRVIEARLRALDDMYLPLYSHALDARARAAYGAVLEAHARRKRFQIAMGQCSVLPETSLRRALLVGDAKQVGQKRVLCIGDDDLVSVALAALGHSVTVWDIDDYLIDFFNQLVPAAGLDIQVEQVDLRDPLEAEQPEAFDLFLTDPMSNRDFFEVFLSRAFGLLKPDGAGFVAVFAPAGRLFQTVAKEMKIPIERWHRRHNRYYSPFIKVHWYESDWVEVRKGPKTTPKYAPEELCAPLSFYREDYYMRKATVFSLYDEIEEPHYAKPMFLDMVMDALQDQGDVVLLNRDIFAADDWSVIKAGSAEGHLTVHVDRVRRQILLEMYPFDREIEERLRNLLLAAYKSGETQVQAGAVRGVWDIRLA